MWFRIRYEQIRVKMKVSSFTVFKKLLKGVGFDELSAEEKKEYNIYLINNIVSMHPTFIIYANILQMYYNEIGKKEHYHFLQETLPSNFYAKYISSKKKGKYNKELIKIYSKHFEISTTETKEELDTLLEIKKFNDVSEILKMYGYSQKEIKKLLKVKK